MEAGHNTINYMEQGGAVWNVNGTLNVDNEATLNGAPHTVVATFDTAIAANKAIGAHGLGVYIPAKAVILDGFIDVLTTATSATDAATLAAKVEGTADTVAAIAISDATNPWDAGLHAVKELNTAATMVKTTARREITVTTAVEALTAGKFNIVLRYVVSA